MLLTGYVGHVQAAAGKKIHARIRLMKKILAAVLLALTFASPALAYAHHHHHHHHHHPA